MVTEEINIYFTWLVLTVVAGLSLYTLRSKEAFHRLVLHPVSVFSKAEYHRVVSAAFVHNNMPHLLLNLFMLFIFCSGLEESTAASGKLPVLMIFAASLICGNLVPLLINRSNLHYSSAGASGAVFGCMVAYLLFHPYDSLLSLPPFGAVPNIYTVAGYLAVLLIMSRKMNKGNVDHSIHLGGGAGGLLATLILYPELVAGFMK